MSIDEFDIQLELKERINYTEILALSIKNQKELMKSETFSLSKLHLMIIDDLTDIPYTWYDTQFQKDIENVVQKRKVPNIVRFSGRPLSKSYMEKHNIPYEKEVMDIDYFRLKLAIRNLLDRLNMLIRKDKIEMSTGKNLEIESLDDLIDKMGEDEE